MDHGFAARVTAPQHSLFCRCAAAEVPPGGFCPRSQRAACHARNHRLPVNRRRLPAAAFLGRWRERHPGVPVQLQLPMERPAAQGREAAAAA